MADKEVTNSGSLSTQVGGALVQLLSAVYGDIAKPSAVAVGRALGTIVETSTALALPFELWTKKRRLVLENNLKKFESELQRACDANGTIIAAAPEIGNPILERLTYTSDDALSGMFIKLLRRASIAQESGLAHPRFVEIISNLSPDEARILSATCEHRSFRCIGARWESISKMINGKRERNYYIGERLLCNLEDATLILFPKNIPTYLRSLQSIGLIEIFEDISELEADPPNDEYNFLMDRYRHIACDGMVDKDNFRSRVMKGRIDYTEFGNFFLSACVSENQSDNKKIISVKSRKKLSKQMKETLVVEPDRPKISSKPLPDIFQDTQYVLLKAIDSLADQALIPANQNYAKRAKLLRDMKVISRADYSILQDFWTIAVELSNEVGIEEEQLGFAIRAVNDFLKKYKFSPPTL
jgi:Abortive infection alpha